MLKKQISSVLFLLMIGLCSFAQLNEVKINLLPNNHIIPIFTADMRAHKMSVFYHSNNNRAEFNGSIGGLMPVAALNYKKFKSQASIGASVYTTLLRAIDAGDLINVDFFVDIIYDIKLNKYFALRTGLGHTSQHLSDDAINKKLYVNPINYVRDYYQGGLVYRNNKFHLMLYAVLYYNHNFKTTDSAGANNLSGNTLMQTGFEYSPLQLGKHTYLFTAVDIKFRGEHNFGSNQNLQLGVKFKGNYNRLMRLVVNYTSGYEERGQFYQNKRNFLNGGLILEF